MRAGMLACLNRTLALRRTLCRFGKLSLVVAGITLESFSHPGGFRANLSPMLYACIVSLMTMFHVNFVSVQQPLETYVREMQRRKLTCRRRL